MKPRFHLSLGVRARRSAWFWWLACCGVALGLHAEPWTLERAVSTALTNNPDARIARQRVAAAEALLQQANAAYWPQLMVGAGYTRTDNPMQVFGAALNQQRFDFGMNFNHVPDVDNLNLNGQVLVPLYRGGQNAAARREARAQTQAAAQGAEAVRQALALEVARSFLTARKAGALREAAQAAEQAFEAGLSVVRRRQEAGTALKQEVLDVEVRLALAREDVVRARNAQKLSLEILRTLIAAKTPDLEISPEAPTLALPQDPVAVRRAELEAAARQTEAAQAAVRRAQAGYQPRVDAIGRYDYDHGWRLDGTGDSYTLGVQAQWNLWDGNLTRSKVREARAALAAAEEAERKLQLAVELEINQARLGLQEADERLNVTTQIVPQAAESARLLRARLEQGLALPSQLIDAESAALGARVRRAEAEADRLMAIAALRRALGLPLDSSPVSSP